MRNILRKSCFTCPCSYSCSVVSVYVSLYFMGVGDIALVVPVVSVSIGVGRF